MTITAQRKSQFCRDLLARARTQIGFADVGSGGALKSPWNLLPPERIEKFDFDAEALRAPDHLPICVSNEAGEKPFYLARDPRSSSLHPASPAFVERFGQDAILARETIRVRCITLDQFFAERLGQVDLLDVNVEGHDFQVLTGAARLLSDGFVKCIKVEFELIEVWQSQGWFGDIDALLRGKQYELAHIEIESSRPRSARAIYHPGEPLWGKAIYVPSPARWSQRASVVDSAAFEDDLLKAVVLYVILDIPGRSLDLLHQFGDKTARAPEIASRVAPVFKYARLDAVGQHLAARIRWVLQGGSK